MERQPGNEMRQPAGARLGPCPGPSPKQGEWNGMGRTRLVFAPFANPNEGVVTACATSSAMDGDGRDTHGEVAGFSHAVVWKLSVLSTAWNLDCVASHGSCSNYCSFAVRQLEHE